MRFPRRWWTRGAVAVPLVLSLAPSYARSQDSLRSPWPVVAASIVPAGFIGAALYQNYTLWNDDKRVPFHISNDPAYALHNDKLGHAFFTSFSSDLIRLGYTEAGIAPRTSALLGFAFGLTSEMLVEIEDGFRGGKPYYGFSFGDVAANLAGASLPLLRTYYPTAYLPQLKMSVWPSSAYDAGGYSSILDDNESQFFWLSLDLPDAIPAWLNVAAGYGVENLRQTAFLPGRHNPQPAAHIYIAPDIDLRQLPIKGKVWEIVSTVLSHFRVPLPALQITPRVKFWGLR